MADKLTTRRAGAGRRPGGAEDVGRELLLDAAVRLFAERGIANTTVAEIAAAAHVTSGMVHYWFDTRDKLLDAIVEERVAPLIDHIWETDAEAHEALAAVRGLIARMFEVTGANPWLPSLWLREIIQEGGLLRERALSRIPMERNAAFRRAVVRAQREGSVNPDANADLLLFSILGLVMLPQASAKGYRRFRPDVAFDHATLERHVLALVMHGLTGHAGGKRRKPS